MKCIKYLDKLNLLVEIRERMNSKTRYIPNSSPKSYKLQAISYKPSEAESLSPETEDNIPLSHKGITWYKHSVPQGDVVPQEYNIPSGGHCTLVV